jgi:hypothetical protein
MAKQPKESRVSFRISEDELESIQQTASDMNLSMTDCYRFGQYLLGRFNFFKKRGGKYLEVPITDLRPEWLLIRMFGGMGEDEKE